MTNIRKKRSEKKESEWTCVVSVCSGSTKVNYYANANQRGTRREKKRKGNNDFSPDCRYCRKNNVRAQKKKENDGNSGKCEIAF